MIADIALFCLGFSERPREESSLSGADRRQLAKQLELMVRVMTEPISPRAMSRIAEIAFATEAPASCNSGDAGGRYRASSDHFRSADVQELLKQGLFVPPDERQFIDAS